MLTITIKRGTRAEINAAAAAGQLVVGEPYLITDEGRIAIGTGTHSYQAMAKQGEGGTGGGGTPVPDVRTWLAQPAPEFADWLAQPDSPAQLAAWLTSPTGVDAAALADQQVLANLTGNASAANLLLAAPRALRLLSEGAGWAQWTASTALTAVQIPAMTSTTAPSGHVTSSGQNGPYNDWHAFDQRPDWLWLPGVAQPGEWLAYQFAQPVYIHTAELTPGGMGGPTGWHIEYSDDGVQWHTALEVPSYSPANGVKTSHRITAAGRHAHWRFYLLAASGFGSIDELQLKGFA